ncbi:Fic family protein [Mesorhizobium sp. J428]|uniref:Fic family protein n=1 Tax=Mesorhizobium sp. J428 TaxID=2898440 RepID=UPI00215104BA|nr:Fic family protein [Mesorhizobium sp. J428]MCR5858273.1 Fic family protein [Mesorhizobium sp. J428]
MFGLPAWDIPRQIAQSGAPQLILGPAIGIVVTGWYFWQRRAKSAMLSRMWKSIEEKKQRLDAMRPLGQQTLEALRADFDIRLTYTSNAIEGNTLTLRETALILRDGVTVGGKPLKDLFEAVDHFNALQFVRELAEGAKPIGEAEICRIHEMVMAQSKPDMAGVYSQFQRRIVGSGVVFPNPVKIPALMDELGVWLSGQPAAPRTAFEAHFRLVAIHPFSDGNGRTARLLMNLILLRDGWPPVEIGPEQRDTYLNALERRSVAGDGQPYEALMLERLDAGLDEYLERIEKEVEARLAGPTSASPQP